MSNADIGDTAALDRALDLADAFEMLIAKPQLGMSANSIGSASS